MRPLLALAAPAVLGTLATQSLMVVDTVMISGFGTQAIGGASLALLVSFATVLVARGIQRGMDPLVSQASGAGEREAAGCWLQRAAWLGLILAMPVALLHWFAEPVLRILGQPGSVLPLAGQWCRIFAVGLPAIMVHGALQQFLQCIGVMRPVTLSILLGNVLNLGLNLLFMNRLGWGPTGCAWSTVISEWVMLGICLFLARDTIRDWWPQGTRKWRQERGQTWRLFQLGLPIGIQHGLEIWGFSIAGIMVGWQGETALAAHTLCLNLATISFMVPLGIGIAAGTRVGNLLGARAAWGIAAWTAIGMGFTAMMVPALLFSLGPGWVLGLYRPDPVVLAMAVGILPIAGAFQLFDGVQAVAFGLLRGAGDLKVPAIANGVGYYLVGLPLGYHLSQRFGVRGIWMGLTMALATVAVLLLLRIRSTLAHGGFRLR